LKIPKRSKLAWNLKTGVVVDGVLAILWIDHGPVTMLTTIHQLQGDDWEVDKERKRPRKSALNAEKVREVFGNSPSKILKIPRVIKDYNSHMGGVDQADQLRGYHTTQITSRRTWMPLFFWLIDTALVNSFILAKHKGWSKSPEEFRNELLWSLIKIAEE
jgi:hypothetical protein